MNRYKPLGWRYESHRHYLAAKGIKTRYDAKKYMALSGNEDRPIPIDPERLEFLINSGYDNQEIAVFFNSTPDKVVKAKMEHGLGGYNKESAEEESDSPADQKYMALKDMFKSNGSDNQPMEDERPFYKEHKLKSEGMNLRMHDIGKMHDKVMNQLDEAVQKGELDPHKREEFFTGDFKRAKEDYLNKTYNTSQFNDEVERSLTYFLKVNGKNLHVFFWADKQKKEPDQNREYLSGSHVGSGVN